MTTETQQQYEGAILSQLIKNSEPLAVVERDIAQLQSDVATLRLDVSEIKPKVESIDATLGWIKWLLGAIAIGSLGNIFSQPLLATLHLV